MTNSRCAQQVSRQANKRLACNRPHHQDKQQASTAGQPNGTSMNLQAAAPSHHPADTGTPGQQTGNSIAICTAHATMHQEFFKLLLQQPAVLRRPLCCVVLGYCVCVCMCVCVGGGVRSKSITAQHFPNRQGTPPAGPGPPYFHKDSTSTERETQPSGYARHQASCHTP
jgi:hypothetical protein